MDNRDLSLVMDFYELTMSQVYFNEGKMDECVTFDLFYRKNPDNAGYSLCAGLEQVIDFVKRFKFSQSDLEYLKNTKQFTDEFLEYLKNFKFKGDIYAIREGTPVFPNEPIIRVKGNIIEAQLLETALLLCINHQTMIATKAHRIVEAAEGRAIMEFGARRSHNFDAAIYGARAADIGGVVGTLSNGTVSSVVSNTNSISYCAQGYIAPMIGNMQGGTVEYSYSTAANGSTL